MKKRLMVVDDSRVMELQICKLLENSKYEVVAYCENGEEAIARYEEVQPDIVTMDIIMPGIDGLEAAQVIAEAHPDARIIMISSLAYDICRRWSSGMYRPARKEGGLNRAGIFVSR